MASTNEERTDTNERTPLGRAADVVQAARERTSSAYEAARSRATRVGREASEQLTVYPVAAVVGGFAVGALLAVLLPGTKGEKKLLGNTGKKITEAARDVAQRGFDAGKDQLEELRAKAAQKVGEAVVDAVGGGKS
jgi:hypothetical protein